MGKGIQNYPNILAADADYLNGSIKDNPGDNSGTHFSKTEYQDIHQTFAKFLRDSVTTANGLFDNESNGYQYFTAIRDLFAQHRQVNFKQGAATSAIYDSDYSPIIIFKSGAAAGHNASLATPNAGFTGLVTLMNYSANSQNVVDNAGTNNFNGVAGPYALPSMRAVEFKYSAGNWLLQNLRKL